MKKAISIILSALLIFTIIPLSSVSALTDGYFEYDILDDGTVKITGYTGGTLTTIPDKLDGKTVTTIGDYAFFYCASDYSITIPASVTYIGDNAFRYNGKITILNPSIYISALAFYDCYIGEATAPAKAFWAIPKKNLQYVIINGGTYIDMGCFDGCSVLESVMMSNSITQIESNAFSNCKRLTNITMSDNVQTIKSLAFKGCSALENITIPNSVKTIGDYAFDCCYNLTSVTIGSGVESIGTRAFGQCGKIERMAIYGSETIANEAFLGCDNLTSITLGPGVKNFENVLDFGLYNLETITVDDANPYYSVADGIMFNKDKTRLVMCPPQGTTLTNYQIPNSVAIIEKGAFWQCSALESITIPDSVVFIGDKAFSGCSALDATMGDSVRVIGKSAFYGCTALKSLTIPDSMESIGSWAFAKCTSLKSISIPGGVADICESTFDECTALASVTIEQGVKTIGQNAFKLCTKLTSISIPDSVTTIGYAAFVGCDNLKSVTVPDSVTEIDYYAFGYGSWSSGAGDDEADPLVPGFVLRGKVGSAAEKYAKSEGITFVAVGEQPEDKPSGGGDDEKPKYPQTGGGHSHSYKWVTVKKATYFAAGKAQQKCDDCGKLGKTKAIKKLKLKKPVIKLAAGKRQITVSYDKIKDAQKYEIYVKVGKKWVKKATVKRLKYTVKKLETGKKYSIKVRVVTTSGKKSAYSAYSKVKSAKSK